MGGKRKGHISVNQLHFLAACFYGSLLNFNIFQSCQVISVLFGLDRRGITLIYSLPAQQLKRGLWCTVAAFSDTTGMVTSAP